VYILHAFQGMITLESYTETETCVFFAKEHVGTTNFVHYMLLLIRKNMVLFHQFLQPNIVIMRIRIRLGLFMYSATLTCVVCLTKFYEIQYRNVSQHSLL
jgi:uncharacterized membrane protein YesL